MKTWNYEIKDNRISATISVSKTEFNKARSAAYINHTDLYPVQGKAPGMATLEDLALSYGPAVLYDEALEILIPQKFQEFLKDTGVRIMGKPQVDDIRFTKEGGVEFHIAADGYPEVTLGTYLGIKAPFRRSENQHEFEQYVIQRACENLQGEVPSHMVDMKLAAIEAQTKLDIQRDSVYHLLADLLVIVDQAYVAADVTRSKNQVRREAMDLMLQTASQEHEEDWKSFMMDQLSNMAERYHALPADFNAKIEKIFKNRQEAKANKKPEELTEELWEAYLGSLELSKEQWKNQTMLQAQKEVCLDLLLDAVATKEKLDVDADEIHHFIEELAGQYEMSAEQAEANIDKAALKAKLLRDKALALILNSAVTDEEAKKKLDEARKKAAEKVAVKTEVTE